MGKKIFIYIIFVILVILFICTMGSGLLYVLSFILEFEFIKKFGPLLFFVDFFLGIFLLIPISILFDTLAKYLFGSNIILLIGLEGMQFLMICGYLHSTNAFFNIIEYGSFGGEILMYFGMYIFLAGLKFMGDKVKDRDTKTSV
jgi:hypothetical protein